MTKKELLNLINEVIEEVRLEDGIALYHAREKEKGYEPKYFKHSTSKTGHIGRKTFFYSDIPDNFVINIDFDKTRLEDLIVFDNRPIKAYTREGIEINSYIPYRFKTVPEIQEDYFKSDTEISRVYYGRPKKISNLKTSLRRAIKNLKSTEDVNLTSKNIEDIKQMVANGVKKFNSQHYGSISSFDLIIKVPSSAPLNDLILEEMKKYVVNGKPKIITDPVFIKNQVKNINFNYQKWNDAKYKNIDDYGMKLSNLHYLRKLRNALKDSPEQEFQMKNVSPADLRSYIKNFITINPKISKDVYDDIKRLGKGTRTFRAFNAESGMDDRIYAAVNGGKVLIIDDTVGAYRTLIQTALVANTHFKPKRIYSFALLSDWFTK